MKLSEVTVIKSHLIALLALILGLFAAQKDSAGTNPVDTSVDGGSGYVYIEFNSEPEGEGLLPYYHDPASRGSLISFVERMTGDAVIAEALVVSAVRNNIDPALIVALSWQESKFNSSAWGKNTNGSVDRGLMQLNSYTFPDLTAEDFYDPEINARLGAGYLRETLDRAGNTVAALAMYNAGPTRVGMIGAPMSTLDYIDNIIDYRDDLIRSYREFAAEDGILVTGDIKSAKNPDLL